MKFIPAWINRRSRRDSSARLPPDRCPVPPRRVAEAPRSQPARTSPHAPLCADMSLSSLLISADVTPLSLSPSSGLRHLREDDSWSLLSFLAHPRACILPCTRCLSLSCVASASVRVLVVLSRIQRPPRRHPPPQSSRGFLYDRGFAKLTCMIAHPVDWLGSGSSAAGSVQMTFKVGQISLP